MGRNRADDCKPDQIVALAVKDEAMIGRSLVAVVQNATFEWAVLHKHVNFLLQGSSTIGHPYYRKTKMGILL
jgi:hypothetical protein